MLKHLSILVFSLLFATLTPKHSCAQVSNNDTIALGGVVVNSDTFAMVYMDYVYIKGKMSRKMARQRRRYNKLRHNIYKVYPYAVIAADVLKDVDSTLLAIGDNKQKRKAYLKTIENELKRRFKGEISDMTISQGHLLVKLIDRQTGKSCYHIIKELKGGFSAVVIQSVATIFTHNLKKEYDPLGDDKEIEEIVRELEANRYFDYMYQQYKQQNKRSLQANNGKAAY